MPALSKLKQLNVADLFDFTGICQVMSCRHFAVFYTTEPFFQLKVLTRLVKQSKCSYFKYCIWSPVDGKQIKS